MEWRFLTPVSGVFYPAIVIGAAVRRRAQWRGDARRLAACGAAAAAALLAAVTLHADDGGADAHDRGPGDDPAAAPLHRSRPLRLAHARRACSTRCCRATPTSPRPRRGSFRTSATAPASTCTGSPTPQIGRQPVDPNDRGRMGHEHWLQDYGADSRARRRRGARVGRSATSIRAPSATPPHDGSELVSVRAAGRPLRRLHAAQSRRCATALGRPAAGVLRCRARIADRRPVAGQAERYAGWRLVDQPRLGRRRLGDARTPSASRSRPGRRTSTAGTPSCCAICRRSTRVRLEDNGRRIYGGAHVDGGRRRCRRAT